MYQIFSADNTGLTDITSQLQTAIDNIALVGGTLFIPYGKYLITERIWVHSGVTLLGEAPGASHRTAVTDIKSFPAPAIGWSTTFITNVSNSWKGMFVLQPTSSIKNCIFFDPRQSIDSIPIQTIPTIFSNGGSVLIQDCEFVNCYHAIKVEGGRPVIRNITGQPVIGIEIDGAGDAAVVSEVFWDMPLIKTGPFWDYIKKNGIGFIFRLCDGLWFEKSIAFQYAIGALFDKSIVFDGNKGTNGMVFGFIADQCNFGIVIKSHSWDLRFSNCNLPAADGRYLVDISTNSNYPVLFNGCSFGTFSASQGYIRVSGGLVKLDACSFTGPSTKPKVEKIGGTVIVNNVNLVGNL